MKPSDDEVPEVPEVPDVTMDDEEEIRPRRRSRKRRSRRNEYTSTIAFVAWASFTVIWLFFFAGSYDIFQNIAIVFIALLVSIAAVALVMIPSVQGRRPKASVVSGIGWIAFLIIWIIFFASGFGFYENIGIGIASLLFVGLVNMLIWVPKHGEEGGARISGSAAILWLIFIVLWLPFANDFAATIYYITFYQSIAIVLISLLIMLGVVISPWWGKMEISTGRHVSVGRRPQATVGLLYLWILTLILWMWFLADTYTGYQNVSVVLISFAIFFGIALGMWYSWTRTRDDGPESWISIGIGFAWIIILSLWFWFFADAFDLYQNLAVFIASLLGVAGIGGAIQWQRIRDFESLDWDD